MLEVILNEDHLSAVVCEALEVCGHRLVIATADVKNLLVPDRARGKGKGGEGAASILDVFEELSVRGVEVRLLHSGVPSGAYLQQLKNHVPASLTMRRCPRVHVKAVIADGRWMYLGSANLTGAGLGAKGARRRNFEAGIRTDQLDLIDPVGDMLDQIWTGALCGPCDRKDYCPVPLEEP